MNKICNRVNQKSDGRVYESEFAHDHSKNVIHTFSTSLSVVFCDNRKDGDDKARPVIIHRAILGSVERMIAILTENYAGKW